MDLLLEIVGYILFVAFVGSASYARGCHLELKATKEKLEEAEKIIKYLDAELQSERKSNQDAKYRG